MPSSVNANSASFLHSFFTFFSYSSEEPKSSWENTTQHHAHTHTLTHTRSHTHTLKGTHKQHMPCARRTQDTVKWNHPPLPPSRTGMVWPWSDFFLYALGQTRSLLPNIRPTLPPLLPTYTSRKKRSASPSPLRRSKVGLLFPSFTNIYFSFIVTASDSDVVVPYAHLLKKANTTHWMVILCSFETHFFGNYRHVF